MRRSLIAIVLLLSALLFLAAGAWFWLWQTRSGAEWIWQEAREQLATTSLGATLHGRLSGTLHDGLTIGDFVYRDSNLTARAERVALTASMNLFPAVITVRKLELVALEVEMAEQREEDATTGFPRAIDLVAPVPVILKALRIDGAVIERGETRISIDTIAANGAWGEALSVEVTELRTPEVSTELAAQIALSAPFSIQSQVRIDRLQLPETARTALPWVPEEMDSFFTIKGDMVSVAIEGTLHWPAWLPNATITARVDQPLDNLVWKMEATVPETAIPQSALGERLQAAAKNQGGAVVIRDLTLRASGDKTVFQLEGDSAVTSPWTSQAALAFKAEVDRGQLLSWSVDGDLELTAEGWPAGRFEYTASGLKDVIEASVKAPDLFGGSLSASAQTAAGEGRPWEADLTVKNVSSPAMIEALLPHLDRAQGDQLNELREAVRAKTFDARIRASGRMEPLEFSTDIERFRIVLRDREVTANGQIEYDGGEVSATSLTLASGSSRLVLDGTLGGPRGLELQVDVPDLDDILPGTAGNLTGRVLYRHDHLQGFAASRLRARLTGRDIRIFDWLIGEIRISDLAQTDQTATRPDTSRIPDNAPLSVSLEASNILGPAFEITSVSAALAGEFARHELTISSDLPAGRVQGTLTGGIEGTSAIWSGTLDRFEIVPTGAETWKLRTPAQLRLAENLTVEHACLTPDGEAELCVGIEQRSDGGQEGKLELTSVSIDPFASLIEWPLGFSQQLDGSLSWALHPNTRPSAKAEFEITPGEIIDRFEDEVLLNTQSGMLRFSIESGHLQSGTLDMPFDSGIATIDFGVPDVLAGPEGEIQGRLRVELEDLDVFAHFVPQLVQTDGRLKVDLVVAGTARNPEFEGLIELHEGRAQVLAPGLRLSGIELTGRLVAENLIEVDGSFLAGEGRGKLHANVSLADVQRPAIEVQITGESLTLIDVPDLRLQADTDVTANWRDNELKLSGRIHVPSARFAPRYLPTDTAAESADVVIVAGDVEAPGAEPKPRDWKVTGELEVSMGENVVVDLDLAKADLTGSAQFTWEGPVVPVANGQYDLKGEIQAYGQNLEITRASVRFPQVPADNPHLDIRAERRIYGNSLISHAGVLVHGTLRRPQTEPYTVPVTNADRARALLITGSDFNYEQGLGAVNVGTYISPRFYLSYGVGLFEEGNVITARYDLGRNFGLKATSGQDDTGIDISYTIEK